MNKHLYRIIFSKTLQRLVVVSEIATREGKAKHESQICHSASLTLSKRPRWTLKPLTIGLYSLLGFFYLASAQADELQIRADSSAPKNQQPIVLQTANGLPQVNIQTPNDKGLSHNKYQQFDVAEKGAILNNSRKNVQTEQGGWVQANPYLVGGEAKVILNEVNATKPSQLKGYIEVAGGKADVIIANPSGIHCEGCGVINAGRSTFTTGEVQIENGQVTGYRVEKGAVTVSGRGMDTSRQDYTDIIAKEVKVNAGIWAKELKVTTGKNQVSAKNDSIQVIHAGDATEPVGYAVDVAELGGMYANKIHLIGTENGLGVRNAGHIGAAVSEVKVTTEGQLVNTGYIGAQQDITLQSQHQIENQASGVMYSQQGNLQATSKQKGIQQQGSLIAKGKAQGKGNITLKAKETISQSGESLAEGNIAYQAKNIDASTTSVLAAGVRFTPTATTEEKTINPHNDQGQTLHLVTEQHTAAHGQNLASDHIHIEAAEIDLSQSQTSANRLKLLAKQGDITLANSEIFIDKTATLSTPTTLATPNAKLLANHFLIQANYLNNQQGYWQQTGTNRLDFLLAQGLNNQQGVLRTLGDLNYQGAHFNNQQGVVTTPQSLYLNTQQHTFNNQAGLVSAQQDIQLITNILQNQQGTIQSQHNLTITAPNLTNQQKGKLLALEQLSITSQQLDNQTGLIQANQVTIATQQLDNRAGFLKAKQAEITAQQQVDNQAINPTGSLLQAATLRITTPTLLNQQTKAQSETPTQGLIADTLEIKTDQWFNQSGGTYVSQALNATVAKLLNNQQGELLSLNTLKVKGNQLQLDNQQGVIESHGNLTLDLKQWENIGQVKSAANAKLSIHNDFRLDTPITVDGKLTLKVDNHFANQTQLVTGKGLTIEAKSIENPVQSELSSQKTLLKTEYLLNRGLIDGVKNIIFADQLDNLGSGRIYGDQLAIQSHTLNNLLEADQSATIAARERLDLGVGTLTNYDHALILSQGNLSIGGALDDRYHATGQATFVDNGSATIEALGNGNINTQRLWNHDLHLITGEHHQDQRISEYALNHKSQRYSSLEGWFDRNNNSRSDRNSYFNFYDGRPRVAGPTWVQWHFNRHTVTTTLEHRDPAKILIAGDLRLNGENLVNDVSQIHVGNRIRMGGRIFNQNEKNLNLKGNGVRLENKDLIGEIHRHDEGVWYTMVTKRKRHGIGKKVWAKYGDDDKPFSRDLPIEYFKFKLVDNTIGQAIQPTGTAIRQQTIAQQAALSNLQVDFTQSTPLSAVPHVRAVLPNQLLPQASLYRLNLATNSHVLVETDPRFTNKRQWLSSDYMFDALRADPQTMLKRLGDGYYEQRLVNEQINQLTGQRFLANYTSDYEQYKALMDAGIRYAQRYQLIPGVALSAAQMQELTEDMVWLAPQTVTLKDGSQLQVLVPQVYLVKRDVDVQPTGAIISAKDIEIDVAGEVKNSGSIAGRNLMQISAQNLENYGDISADQLNFNVTNRFYQQGGRLSADSLNLAAGTIQIEGRMSEAAANSYYARRQLDQQALLKVRQALILQSQGDIQLNATQLSAGSALLQANGTLDIGTVTESERSHYVANAENYWKLDQQREIGSTFDIKENAILSGKNGVTLRATQVNSDGDILVNSEQGNIQIQSGRDKENLSFATKYKDKSLLSSSITTIKHDHQYDLTEGSQLAGNNVHLLANQGKVAVEGSTIVADKNVTLQAQELDISAAKNTRKEHDFYAEKKSGLMSSGGLGFTIGSRSEKHDYTDHETTQSDARATIGSLGGDVTLVAGQRATILGTDLIAQPDKTIDITAKSLKVEAGKDIIESTEQHEFKQSGLTVSLSTPTTDMAMKARESLARSQQVKDSRLKALYEIKAAQEGAIAAQEAKKTVDAVQSGQKADFKVSVSIGSNKSSSSSTTTQVLHQGSTLNAGNINLTTTAGDIDVVGSTIQAANSASLTSAKDIHLSSAQDSTSQRSNNKNSGWSAGVFVGSSGGSYGFGIEGSAQIGKGYENSDTITQRNTTVTGQTVNLRSGEDMTLKGAVVTGEKVNVEVGKNLVIESRQDSNHYNSQQVQAGVSASVAIYGSGSNVSANMSLNKAKLNYAQVETQSGIQAGTAGLNVNVAGNTHLKGAVVESQASAENNQFTTGSLTAESIANHSEVKVSSAGGGLSTDPTQNIANGFAAGLSALGNIHQQDSSTTHSAIGSNIQLTTQQSEIPTTLSRNTATANERVQKADMEEVKARQEMAQVIGDIANNGITLVLKPKLDEAERQKAEAEAILKEDKTNAAALEQKRRANDVIKEYGQGGKIQLAVRAVTGVLQGIATGDASQAAVGGLSPYINHQIKEATTDKDGNVNLEANLMAHALLGAIEAYATGNNAAAGAAGAVSGELAASIITKQLYQKSPEQLTEAQKQTVSALSQLASGLAGGLISDSTAGAINSAEIGKRAVENNYLFRHEAEELVRLLKEKEQCEAQGKNCQAIQDRITELHIKDIERDNRLEASCRQGMNAECASELVTLSAAFKSFQGYMLTADNPVMNSQYQQVAIQYGEAQSQRMENIAKAALLQMPKESIEGATVLTQLTIDAVVYGDKQAKEQLAQIGQEIKKFVQSPIETISSQTRETLKQADELETNGYRDEADLIRMKVYLSNELGAISTVTGIAGIGKITAHGIKNIIDKSVSKLPIVGKTTNYENATFIYRYDDDFLSIINAKGQPKARIDIEGNLSPVNPKGTGSIENHIRGGNSGNTPYISFTDPRYAEKLKMYGSNKISVNLTQLEKDIQNGKLSETRIINHKELIIYLQNRVDNAKTRYSNNPTTKNKDRLNDAIRDLSNAQRDGECLIQGCVPNNYIIKEK
ncbi:hemagglutinin repeat-containing protein [Gallibacterium anatis]|uniref:two-partner secretion domain-containing protein n=1 Tax=Gallibacterium anatis TaxID=750 RepID=UPI0038D465E5